nr:SCO-spondin-like [Ciona intestinalis]|eukprot:XP_009862011.1 SCO-spondin-like [Ciona intestinalis]
MRLAVLLCVIAVVTVVEGQTNIGKNCNVYPRRECGQQISTRAVCNSFPLCCFDPIHTPNCYRAQVAHSLASVLQAQILNTVRQVPRPLNLNPLLVGVQSPVISQDVRNSLQSYITNLGIPAALTSSPQCPVNVPICYRTKCGSTVDSETNPVSCMQDPKCCFDNDLLVYRQLFGPVYMQGAPTCYHGPTASKYLQLANSIRPWNPYYQGYIINSFRAVNINLNTVCQASSLINFAFLAQPICGWPGITKLECELKGCCFTALNNKCTYPTFGQQFVSTTYPELKAETVEETQCPSSLSLRTVASPQQYRRLPCMISTSLNDTSHLIACPRDRCCSDLSSLIPSVPLQLGLNFGGSMCPFHYTAVPGLPDLSSKVRGCCQIHSCFHRKRMQQPTQQAIPLAQPVAQQTGFPQQQQPQVQQSVFPQQQQQPQVQQSVFGANQVNNPPPTTTTVASTFRSTESVRIDWPTVWHDWSQWSRCSRTCDDGSQTRDRRCYYTDNTNTEAPPSNCPGSHEQTRRCSITPCSRGSWMAWQDWEPCSETCGAGRQYKIRSCFDGNQISNTCQGEGRMSRSCMGSCHSWSEWGVYLSCTAVCGGGSGIQTRYRTCEGNGNTVASVNCAGQHYSTRPCSASNCVRVTEWGSWSQCSVTCGGGTRSRRRQCFRDNVQVFGNCPQAVTQNQPGCSSSSCQQSDPRIAWSSWTQWSACSATCANGVSFRTRSCRYRSSTELSANICIDIYNGTSGSEDRVCQSGPCPAIVTYSWTIWASYRPCPCGSSSQTKRRYCVGSDGRIHTNGCPGNSTSSRACQGPPCMTWAPWSNWDACSKTCGRGMQVRVRCKRTDTVNCIATTVEFGEKNCTIREC